MKILITGATGLIGKALAISLLKDAHEMKALARNPKSISFLPSSHVRAWDIGKIPLDLKFIEGVDAVVSLAGTPVMEKRWTEETKKEILESRTLGTKEWAVALEKIPSGSRPSVFISGSAIGFYGDRGDEVLDENSTSGSDFLAEVAIAWEKEARAIEKLGLRVVRLRTGIVLSREGGALSEMQPVALGDGSAWMSWIHLDDEVALIRFALTHSEVKSAINAVSPRPVTNQEFAKVFARVKHVPLLLNAPKPVLKLALGQRVEGILSSERVLPKTAEKLGFQFKFSRIEDAMNELYPEGENLNDHLHFAHFIPASLGQVFSFFSDAKNLETLTPPWVGFKILSQSTPNVQKGTLIDYRIRVHGLPLKWRTLIEDWSEKKSFVDTQLKGPYAYWHHEHLFYAVPGGTLMLDHVTFRLPVGVLGKVLGGKFVKKDVKNIFAYRTRKIDEIFGAGPFA